MIETLRNIPFFSGLNDPFLERLANNIEIINFREGETVMMEGDDARGLYWLESGWVKVVKYSPSGREQILSFIKAKQTFNEVGAFSKLPNPATVIALEPVEILVIPKEDIRSFIREDADFSQHVIEVMATRLNHLVMLVEDLSLRQVTSRLARLIQGEAVDGILSRPEWYTQTELASRLGTVTDVVQRSLRKLEEDGIIEVARDQIKIVDPEKINSISV